MQRLISPVFSPCSDVLLCESCSQIDFGKVAVASQFCTRSQSEEYLTTQPDLDLGTIEDVIERKERCNLCALIARRSKGLAGRCTLIGGLSYCISSEQPEFTTEEPHTHTRIAKIRLHPEVPLSWVPTPWELDTHDTHPQSVRQIVIFQAGPKHRTNEPANPATITARRVLSSVDMSLPKQWLLKCEQTHVGRCPHSEGTPGRKTEFMPAFVIDTENHCVIETPSGCRYVALSYVWGAGKMLKHISTNSISLQIPGALQLAQIPQTVKDSMTLVKDMGERYLWVDALCIVQDSPVMQQKQIAKMDQIYAKALFTIVAANGDNAEAGLPGVGLTSREQVQEILHLADGDLYTLIHDISEQGNVIRKSPWAQRAWTFQELLCSGRCLVFTAFQVYWKCHCAVWLEEIALEQTGSTNLELFHESARSRFPAHSLSQEKYFRLYEKLLFEYLKRQLSFQADLINAFSGICGWLSVIQGDRFFWGLPQSQFSRGLSWTLMGRHKRHDTRVRIEGPNSTVQEVPFPSWSWAAWETLGVLPTIGFRGESQPVVDFWVSDDTGTIVPVAESGTHGDWPEAYHTIYRFPRLDNGRESFIVPEEMIQSATKPRLGLLYFWSSVATLELGSHKELIDDLTWTFMCSMSECVEMEDLWKRKQKDENSKIFIDFVVVAERPEEDSLNLLAVEWQQGIAYRLGSVIIKKRDWLSLENREWKLVILG